MAIENLWESGRAENQQVYARGVRRHAGQNDTHKLCLVLSRLSFRGIFVINVKCSRFDLFFGKINETYKAHSGQHGMNK